jgi:hypothetical protein
MINRYEQCQWHHATIQLCVLLFSSLTLKLKLCGDSDLFANAVHLKSAITQLPELTACKAMLDLHMNITIVLLKQIKSHGLDKLFSTENVKWNHEHGTESEHRMEPCTWNGIGTWHGTKAQNGMKMWKGGVTNYVHPLHMTVGLHMIMGNHMTFNNPQLHMTMVSIFGDLVWQAELAWQREWWYSGQNGNTHKHESAYLAWQREQWGLLHARGRYI